MGVEFRPDRTFPKTPPKKKKKNMSNMSLKGWFCPGSRQKKTVKLLLDNDKTLLKPMVCFGGSQPDSKMAVGLEVGLDVSSNHESL